MDAPTPEGPSPAVADAAILSDTAFLNDLRRQMIKFATLQLSNSHAAEDAVQEALMGALKNAKSFAGRAARQPGPGVHDERICRARNP